MASTWKYLKWTLIGITGLFLALVLFLFFWIDPNDYRDDITRVVKDKTGLILEIKGNIGWNFYPAIGFSVEGLSLATAEDQAPLATVTKTVVSVELLPLFSKQITVRTLYVDGLVANLVVNEDGKGNWEALSSGTETTPEPKPTETGSSDLIISVPKVVVTNTVIDYDDRKGKARYRATVKELIAENIGLGTEFPFHLVATAEGGNGLRVDVDTRAFVRLDPAAQVYIVRGLDLKADIAGILAKPFHLILATDIDADLKTQKIIATNFSLDASGLALAAQPLRATVNGPLALNLAADTATIGPLQFSAANLNGTLALDVKDLTRELSFAGTLAVAPFNAKSLLREFSITAPNTTDPAAMTKVSVKTALAGALTHAMLNNLEITLDDTHIKGSAGITDLATQALVFDLAVDAINADRYLPPPAKPVAGNAEGAAAPTSAPAPASAPTGGGKPEPLLPVAMLRTLNVDGKLSAGKITLMEWPMTNLAVAVRAKDGNIHIDPLAATVLDGTVKGNVQIDARGTEPRIVTHLKLDRVEIGGVVKRYAGRDLFAGKASLNLDLDTTGNDIDTLLKKAVGGLDFSFADSLLKGMNLNNMLTETLTQQLGAFSMLVPDYQQKLPKEMQQDTAFNTLAASAKLKDGIAQTPAFNAAIKDGNIKGSGQFNIMTMDFDYTLAMRTDKLKDSKYFANAEFPLHCRGNTAGAPASWCRPDSKAIGEMLKKAAGSAAKDRLKGELAKQLGVDSVDTKQLKAQAEQQAQQKIDEEKQKAEDKAKQQLNNELNKAMKKFF